MAKSSSVTKPSRSGGPQTDEGKKIASQNALKTGAYSNTLILPGEDESQFRQIEDQFIRDFRPEDMAENAMVRDLAVLAWKKIRLENLEQRIALARLNAPLEYFDKSDTKYLSQSRVVEKLDCLSDYSSELQEQTRESMAYVQVLQTRSATIDELEALDLRHPLVHKILVKYIEHFEFTNPTAKNVLRYDFINDDGDRELFWPFFLKEAINELNEIIWFCDHRAQIEQELQEVKDKRLMLMMQNPIPSRAFDDLRRNFYRTLSELRKHQEWKRKMQVIDVSPRNVIDSDEGKKSSG